MVRGTPLVDRALEGAGGRPTAAAILDDGVMKRTSRRRQPAARNRDADRTDRIFDRWIKVITALATLSGMLWRILQRQQS